MRGKEIHFLNALNDFYVLLQNANADDEINHRFHHRNLDNLKFSRRQEERFKQEGKRKI